MSWDKTVPQDTETEKLGDDRIREMKSDLQDALQVENIFPGPNPNTAPECIMALLAGTTAARPTATAQFVGRWYFNRTTGTIQRNNSSPAWEDLTAPIDFIPSGSVMAFYQASAPTGWVQLAGTTLHDRILRVTSGTGTGTGGTDSISSPATHDHGGSTAAYAESHRHSTTISSTDNTDSAHGDYPYLSSSAGASWTDTTNTSHFHSITGVASLSPAYANFILAVKS